MIQVAGLVKHYGDVHAVDGISFSVPAGQVCGYLGPNGAGKSTTLQIIAGILASDEGSVRICGHAPGLEAKRRIGYVPESGALYSLLSVWEHLHLVADLYQLEPDVAGRRMDRLIDLFGLGEVAARRIDTLSKGQRQKVALSTALLHDPEVILFDEPLNGLDATAARAVKEIIRGLAAKGRTILYSSHILDVVERICDRAIILDHGKIVADMPTVDLSGESLESVFLNLTRSEQVEGLSSAFLDA